MLDNSNILGYNIDVNRDGAVNENGSQRRKGKRMTKKKIVLCNHCLEAIRSRGERVTVIDYIFPDEAEERGLVCEWCKDSSDEELLLCEFN